MRGIMSSVGCALVLVLACAAPATAGVPDGATWTEEYIEAGLGTSLHADVLRPKGLPADARTPVLMTVSPYTGHSAEAPLSNEPLADNGPSERFFDFLTAAKVFERGYTYVIVDLPGFGGSSGCNDWGGPLEQAATKAAIEWAAKQSWSNGKVGLYGKSYDGWTGLMAIAQRPQGLAAVVSQEPVVDGYRYIYMNGVRLNGRPATIPSFQAHDAIPQGGPSNPEYFLNGLLGTNPACWLENILLSQIILPDVAYWPERNLVEAVKGATTPLLLNEGFLETNTTPDAVWTLFNNLAGPKRGWFGQWDHVRGTDRAGKASAVGREGWADEAIRFLDHYVKGLPLAQAPTDRDAPITIQDGDGEFREELSWPPVDSRPLALALKGGTYADDGANNGAGAGAGNGIWTVTQPFAHDARIAGVPTVKVDVGSAPPLSNLVVDVYDIDEKGSAVVVSRGAHLLQGAGAIEFELYGNDWRIAKGHRVGVLVSGANADWFTHVPTNQSVTVDGGEAKLPFLTYTRAAKLEGKPTGALLAWRNQAFAVPAATLSQAAVDFGMPAALVPARIKAKVAARGRSVRVSGTAPMGAQNVLVTAVLGKRTIARRTVPVAGGRFSATLRVKRGGRYRINASTRLTGRTLRASASRRVR